MEAQKLKYTIVIKLGTSSICDEKTYQPKLSNLARLVETVVQLRHLGHKVLLVSSGAVGMGLLGLHLTKRPKKLSQIQAVASVGQGKLMALYDTLFSNFNVPIAQILLTRDNLSERPQYLNACSTLAELLNLNVVPIINENDSVTSSELRFGDNDSLSAVAAGMVHADYLFLLTDVDALYTDNPRTNPQAKPLRIVRDIQEVKSKVQFTSAGSSLGTGGMVTKLIAAELATNAGCNLIISLGSEPQKILSILAEIQEKKFNPTIGTHFVAKEKPLDERQWWVLSGLASYGILTIDQGAVNAITRSQKSSLFAAGIKKVQGSFNAQQCVTIVTSRKTEVEDGVTVEDIVEIGRGLVNYSSQEIQRLLGCKSGDIADILGYCESEYVIHRDNIAIKH